MKITAFAAAEAGGTLHPFQYKLEPLQPHQVLIEVSHCGICHSDVHMIDNDWGSSRFPLVPGHEVIGIVVEVGSKVDSSLLKKRVGLGWQSGSCGTCEWCVSKHENLCIQSEATVVKRHGGFASHVVASADFVFEIPDSMESASAAPLLCGGITVFSPLRRAGFKPGQRVGVMGIGGLGHLGLQFAKSMGTHVTALSTSPNKMEEAKTLGADDFLLTSDPGLLKAAKKSLDYLLVTATVDLDWKPYVEMLRPNGTICFVTGEDTLFRMQVSTILMSQLTITGSVIGSIGMIQDMFGFAAAHGISARVETMPMKEVNAALTKVRRNLARYRMVLTN